MHRRAFLHASALAAGTLLAPRLPAAETGPIIRTVTGDVPAAELGLALSHEHVLVDFIGAAEVSPRRYAADEVLAVVQPHLERAAACGVRALFECTPNYLGRDVRLLARLSAATGVRIITNTGLYGARRNQHLPAWAMQADAEALATRWIAEARDGLDGTELRPGFIKCGVDVEAELSPQHRELVRAAALTHRATGLTIAVHTGRGPGLAQLDLLAGQGVAADAFVWVHAQGATDDALFAAADRGAWLSFDHLARHTLSRHLHLCRALRDRGRLEQVLLSHDAGWFDPAKPRGGEFRGYDFLFTDFLPRLALDGFSAAETELLLVRNPARAFAIRRRLL